MLTAGLLAVTLQCKFAAGKKYISQILHGLEIPEEMEQIALLVFASSKNRKTLADGKLVLVDEFLREVLEGIAHLEVSSAAIPEQLPILRSFQLMSNYRQVALNVWQNKSSGKKQVTK